MYLSTKTVADLLGVSPLTVKGWRKENYIDSPLRLVGRQLNWNRYGYTVEEVQDFLARNPKYRERVASLFVPHSLHQRIQGAPTHDTHPHPQPRY